jgi:hypothetical protein
LVNSRCGLAVFIFFEKHFFPPWTWCVYI